jgi:hypothetical protein
VPAREWAKVPADYFANLDKLPASRDEEEVKLVFADRPYWSTLLHPRD